MMIVGDSRNDEVSLSEGELEIGILPGKSQAAGTSVKIAQNNIVVDPSSVITDHLVEAEFGVNVERGQNLDVDKGSEPIQHQNKKYRHRIVRFETDENDRILEQVYSYRAVSEKRRERCYMSRDELEAAVSGANSFAESYASLHEDWHATIEMLLLSDGSNSNICGSDYGDEEQEQIEEDVEEAILILTESNARGLEFSSRLLQKHQGWANKSVLRRFGQLVTSAEGDEWGFADRLRERCLSVNRSTRRLAVFLARGDAIQARIVYEEDSTWERWKS
jgi:hypothetical protein